MIQRPQTKSLVGTRLRQAATAVQELVGILVKLADGTKVRGRLDEIDAVGFVVTTPTADQASVIERRISLSEVKSVKQLKDEPGVGGQIVREAGRTGLRFAITAVVVVVIIAIAGAVGKN